MEKEKVLQLIENIKERLSYCNDRYDFDELLLLEMSDGNHLDCMYAEVRNGKLFVGLQMPYGKPMELGEDELEHIKYINAIYNAIEIPNPKDDIASEIVCKLLCQPELPYTIAEPFLVTLEDGNKYDCMGLMLDNGKNIDIKVFSAYLDEFCVTIDDVTVESLEYISDNIMPPKEILVTVHAGDEQQVAMIHRKEVRYDYTEENLSEYLHKIFPAFDFVPVDVMQMVYYPNKDDDSCYILANCYD